MQYSQEHLKTMVYAEFGGQTECIMGNWKIENGKENTTLRSLRCPHLVLLSPMCLPGTEAINRTLQKNWVLRMLHQKYQALYLLYLFSLDLLQREKFIAIIFILLFCCLYINENSFIN